MQSLQLHLTGAARSWLSNSQAIPDQSNSQAIPYQSNSQAIPDQSNSQAGASCQSNSQANFDIHTRDQRQ
jgi:hypothetical protein